MHACIGLSLANQGKLESFNHGDPLAACLQSIDRGDLSSNSLDGISRQLLGSLGNLPENDPVLRDMLASMASAPAMLGENSAGVSRRRLSLYSVLGFNDLAYPQPSSSSIVDPGAAWTSYPKRSWCSAAWWQRAQMLFPLRSLLTCACELPLMSLLLHGKRHAGLG